MHSLSRSGSGTASWSVTTPMQATPSWVTRVAIIAEPGTGPNGYMRSMRAPARYDGRVIPGKFEACRFSELDDFRVTEVSTPAGSRLITPAVEPRNAIA